MPNMEINVEGTGGGYSEVFQRQRTLRMPEDIPIRVETLDHGMKSGQPSIAFIIELPSLGYVVLAQTSMKLFQMAAHATFAKYGDCTGAMMGRFSPGGVAELTLSEEMACPKCLRHIPGSCKYCPECGGKQP